MDMINSLLLTKGTILESRSIRVAQNIANYNNYGFKESKNINLMTEIRETIFPNIGPTYKNKSVGAVQFTERAWDFYLQSEGEFGFISDEGIIMYSRGGDLRIDEVGLLTSKSEGLRIVDISGAGIRLTRDKNYNVLGNGKIFDDNNKEVAQIGVFDRLTGKRMQDVKLGRGGLEASNTSPIEQYSKLTEARNQYFSIKNWIEIEDQRQRDIVKEILKA